VTTLNLADAELSVYAYCPRCGLYTDVTPLVYDGRKDAPRHVNASVTATIEQPGDYVGINVTDLVRWWAEDERNNYGVQVVVERESHLDVVFLNQTKIPGDDVSRLSVFRG